MITLGILSYQFFEDASGNSKNTSVFGLLLVLIALFSDGMLATA